jgi:hypothetical protein
MKLVLEYIRYALEVAAAAWLIFFGTSLAYIIFTLTMYHLSKGV